MLRMGIGERFYTVPYGFEEGIFRMRKQGYTAMDYSEFDNTETELFRMDNYQFTKYLQYQSEVCAKEGIEIFQTHGPWRWPTQDVTEADRAERFGKMCRAIEGTAILGCKNIILHPIFPFSVKDEGYEKENFELNLEFMSKVCRVAREHDIVINFENMPMPHYSMSSTADILKVVKEINDDCFKVCLDTGHSTAIGDSPAEDVRMLGKDYLRSLHIHDNDGRHDFHWHPFAGVVDWEDFCDALKEISFEGVMNLEVGRQKNLPKELWEMEELFLYRKIEYLAKQASQGE